MSDYGDDGYDDNDGYDDDYNEGDYDNDDSQYDKGYDDYDKHEKYHNNFLNRKTNRDQKSDYEYHNTFNNNNKYKEGNKYYENNEIKNNDKYEKEHDDEDEEGDYDDEDEREDYHKEEDDEGEEDDDDDEDEEGEKEEDEEDEDDEEEDDSYKYNCETGDRGEEIVYNDLKNSKFEGKLTWTNQKGESFSPYDFAIENGGKKVYIDSKATICDKNDAPGPIISANEEEFINNLKPNEKYIIARVYNARGKKPKIDYFDAITEEKISKSEIRNYLEK